MASPLRDASFSLWIRRDHCVLVCLVFRDASMGLALMPKTTQQQQHTRPQSATCLLPDAKQSNSMLCNGKGTLGQKNRRSWPLRQSREARMSLSRACISHPCSWRFRCHLSTSLLSHSVRGKRRRRDAKRPVASPWRIRYRPPHTPPTTATRQPGCFFQLFLRHCRPGYGLRVELGSCHFRDGGCSRQGRGGFP